MIPAPTHDLPTHVSPDRPPSVILETMLIVPNALTAAALEHVDDLPGVCVHHCSHKLQPFATEAAKPGRGTFDLGDFLCPIQLHGPLPKRHMLLAMVNTALGKILSQP
jgi:hypothetical protein